MRWLRNNLVNYLTRNLLKAVTEEDVLLISGKDWLLNKRKLTNEEILVLKEEATSFSNSILYKLMKRELKYDATLQRYDKATTADDMIFGKAMIYDFKIIEDYVNNIKTL